MYGNNLLHPEHYEKANKSREDSNHFLTQQIFRVFPSFMSCTVHSSQNAKSYTPGHATYSTMYFIDTRIDLRSYDPRLSRRNLFVFSLSHGMHTAQNQLEAGWLCYMLKVSIHNRYACIFFSKLST